MIRLRAFGLLKLAILPAASLLLTITANAQFSPAPASPFAVGTHPYAVAVADVNADGIADIAVANATSNDVTVLLGNGSGGFNPASGSPFTVGTSPHGIAAGDLNGDGKPDLAVANGGSNDVTLLIGNGSGGFSASPGGPVAVGTFPVFITVGDFNQDGLQDLAVANENSSDVTVLLGNSSSTSGFVSAPGSPFVPGIVSPTITAVPTGVAVGDFNGDGAQDIAVVFFNTAGTRVLVGNGSGGFTLLPSTLTGASSGASFIVVADFNRDGILDTAVAESSNGGGIFVSLGNGSGGFSQTSNLLQGPYTSIALGDFNGDGNQDLAAVFSGFFGSPGAVSTLLGNGAGKFTEAPPSPYTVGHNATSVAAGDFNRDGKPDLTVANSADNNITLLLNVFSSNSSPFITARPASVTFYAGTGQPAPTAIPVTVNSSPAGSTYSVTSNQPWLSATPPSNATGAPTTETISVSQNSLNAGTYSGTVAYSAPNFPNGKTAVTLNVANPSGTLREAQGSPVPVGTYAHSIAAGDFNGDGKLDFAVPSFNENNVTVMLGNGSGQFNAAPGSPFAAGTNPGPVAAGDFNGDGKMDLAVLTSLQNSPVVLILLGNGTGAFSPAPGNPIAVAGGGDLVAADFNGDGKLDLAVPNTNSNNVAVLLGNGSAGFSAAFGSPFAAGSSPQFLAVGDFDGNGTQDLAAASQNTKNVAVLLGNGSGGFSYGPGSPFAVGAFPGRMAVGDFNRDGIPDLAIVNSGDNNVSVLLGNGSGAFTIASGSPLPVGTFPISPALGDFNGDGAVDLAITNFGNNNVTVLLGHGSGGFGASGPFEAGNNPYSLVAGDFSGDGRTDLAVQNTNSQNVTVLLGALAATSSTLTTTSPATISYGTSVPLTLATSDTAPAFNAPSGIVTFSDGSTVLGTASQSASPYSFTASGLSVGSHTLTATYSGDTRNASSTSNSITIQVNPGSQTVPVTDNFNGPALNTNLWRFVNPVGDGSYSLKGSRLQLNVPGGSNHDPAFGGVDNTVRVVQPIGNADFTVEAQFDSIPVLQSELEGIVVEQDSANHLSFTIGSTGSSIAIDARAVLAGSATVATGGVVVTIPEETKSLWLRVSKSGDTWTESWSRDGSNWAIAGSFSQPLTPGNIGPFAGNYNSPGTAAPAFTAEVKYFRNTSLTGEIRSRVRKRAHDAPS